MNDQSRLDSWRRYGASEKGKLSNKRKKEKRRSTPGGQLDYILCNRRGLVRKKGRFFDDRLLELAKNPPATCPCCRNPFIYGTGQGDNPRSPSIDKVIATGEYTLDNVMIICKRCNQIKNQGTVSDHLAIIAYMKTHFDRRAAGVAGRVEIAVGGVKAAIAHLGKGIYETARVGGHGGRKPKTESVRLRPWNKFDHIVRNARVRAHKDGRPFDDDLLFLPQNLPSDCACCGTELLYEAEGQNPRSASIDRIDCLLGYAPLSNIDIICMKCNGTKNDGSIADHEMVVAYMTEHAKQHQK